MLVYLRGLGISEIRDLFFRGHIWMRLKNSCSFCVGQVPGTSHVATRPNYRCERRIYPSLSRPFAAGPAFSLFVVVQSLLDVIRIPGTVLIVASPIFSPSFLFFFVGWFLNKKKLVLEEIILFAAACCIFTIKFSFFYAFLSPPKCMHQGRMVIVMYQRSSLLPKMKWLYSCIHTSF